MFDFNLYKSNDSAIIKQEVEQMSTKARGGKRIGAGRPRKDRPKTERLTLMVDPDFKREIIEYATTTGGTVCATARELLEAGYYRNQYQQSYIFQKGEANDET